MKVVGITQARLGSTRLPDKVLAPIGKKSVLELQLHRLRRAATLDELVVATTTAPADRAVVERCGGLGVRCIPGSEADVLDRFYQAARQCQADVVVRFTADCPLIDPELIDAVVRDFLSSGVDYESNVHPPTFPDGIDIEVFTFAALEAAWLHFGIQAERGHVTRYIVQESTLSGGSRFRGKSFTADTDLSELRMTLDTAEDLQVIAALVAECGEDAGWRTFAEHLQRHPELRALNAKQTRNESYLREVELQLAVEARRRSVSYRRSEALLKEACALIPLGSQTFSKSKLQFPFGASPYFAERASGSKMWDVDGNEYIDFTNALLSVLLGHCDPDVTRAVQQQLAAGTIYSISHPLEIEVAQKICSLVPSAEMVRFSKNGSDATSAAVRIARAHTRRNHILVCGYHGWHDWYIGATTRNLGVPNEVSALTHQFVYNNIASLEELFQRFTGDVAAVVMEPVNVEPPRDGFLEQVRELTHRHGALLVFDEIITGFRFAPGGAQEYFGVLPDLTALGKGLANGFPISAVAGRAELMKVVEEIFFSATFGGETLSLAAAAATLHKVTQEPVIPHLFTLGTELMSKLRERITAAGLEAAFRVGGYPPWSFFLPAPVPGIDPNVVLTLHRQEMLRSGIMMLGSHNLSYAHTQADVSRLLEAYDYFFDKYLWGRSRNRLRELLEGELLQPIFRVR